MRVVLLSLSLEQRARENKNAEAGDGKEFAGKNKNKTMQSESAHSKLICMFSLDYIVMSDIPDRNTLQLLVIGLCACVCESHKEFQTGLWEDGI